MAMCASGELGIIAQPQGVGSSISCCVTGSASFPPYSLTTLSTTVGKAAPHAMSEFYGYAPVVWCCVDMLRTNSIGTDGTSALVGKVHCLRANAGLTLGGSYDVTLSANLCALGSALGSYSIICVTCNTVQVFCCCTNGCGMPTCKFNVVYNDTVIICTGACEFNLSCIPVVKAEVCLQDVTAVSGDICRGSTCTFNCTWTG